MRLIKGDKIEIIDRHSATRALKLKKRQTATSDNRKSIQLISKLGKKTK